MNFYNYFSLLLQEMNLNFDEEFLVRILNFVEGAINLISKQSDGEETESLSKSKSAPEESKMIYFQVLHLQPILANVSFVGVPGVEEK
jgi:hypothetical protein